MNDELRRQVWSRANDACEYCRMPQSLDPLVFGIDHIRPQYHHGPTVAGNLCLACFNCNTYKAADVAGYDPDTDKLNRLFNPREDSWDEHLAWQGAALNGQTPIGRTTIDVLRINLPERLEQRRLLIVLEEFPQ